MTTRLARLICGIVGFALVFTAVGTFAQPTTVAADEDVLLPSYVRMVEEADAQTWSQQPASEQTGTVAAVVHIRMTPLAMVGKNWTHQQRVDYVQQIRAEQDKLIPQIEQVGGKVRGRFTQASTGLAIEVDAEKLQDIREMSNVVAARSISNYELDLTETVDWIGGIDVQELGYTGDGVDVAVIDSGVDYTHKKLGGPGTLEAYAEAYCGDPEATPDPTDPACTAFDSADTTGYFPNDKVKGGYDWVGEVWPNGPATSDPNPIDFEGHGTHVADIIGGFETEDGAGDAGVAPDVNIWGFRGCSAVAGSCEGLALLLSVDDALDLDDSDYGLCEGDDCKPYDPADVINMSLGSSYGQPEDDLTLFTNIASYYGSLVVASAGNSADKPYIVGSPSAAEGALSVAQSTVPSAKFFNIAADAVTVGGIIQPWGPSIDAVTSGPLQYGDGEGGNLNGCAPFEEAETDKAILVDRGACAVSVKAANASAAGAVFVIIANNQVSNTPPSFSFGGGDVTIPALTTTLVAGDELKTVLESEASIGPDSFTPLQDDIIASSSRGPRVADGDIKPDMAAPGASISAVAGSGTGKEAFGGTSGAAPMVAGAAALIIEALEDRGILDEEPGLDGPSGSFAPVVKSILMNNANPNTYIGGKDDSGFLAPITLQGAGRVDALAAFEAETVAWDITELQSYLNDPEADPPCSVFPVLDVLLYDQGVPPDCADDFPFGNDFFNAWNKQTGSMSFGYDGVSAKTTETRKVAILNFSGEPKTYDLGTSFRYGNDKGKGVTLKADPSEVTVDAGESAIVDVTLTVNAKDLRDWTLDGGEFGSSGTDIFCDDCPTLQVFEYDGYLKIKDGDDQTVKLPWQVLPKKAADTYVANTNSSSVKLRNPAEYKTGDVDVFSLLDISPNNCEVVDGFGDCIEEDYVPGILPGINTTAVDIKEAGIRSYQAPGLNDEFGLPSAPTGAINDEIIEFGLTVYDKPFRAGTSYPVRFEAHIDADTDGTVDYIVFNDDIASVPPLGIRGFDGRNAVFVTEVETGATQPYLFSATDLNSQNWILPVPASAIGVASNRPFNFFILGLENYFAGTLQDCSPFNDGVCGGEFHTYQTGLPKYRPVTTSLQVPTRGSYTLPYATSTFGEQLSPSQIGLLFMYRDALVGRESDGVPLD
ncbi:MAG: S8 family serine peptidase [Chloroflexota bacterium]